MTAESLIPPDATWDELVDIAAGCQACHLYERGTQTVFGAGPVPAPLLMVGEQPGDQEDLQGEPFVGPAGRELDRGLAVAGIDRDGVYLSNIVKHFKWQPRGKRRIHDKPNAAEIEACIPWLWAEVERVDPRLVVTLGATASQALLGPKFRVTKERGVVVPGPHDVAVVATVHPSSILRTRGDDARADARAAFVTDLQIVAKQLAGTA